jgi:hypothetical protein
MAIGKGQPPYCLVDDPDVTSSMSKKSNARERTGAFPTTASRYRGGVAALLRSRCER